MGDTHVGKADEGNAREQLSEEFRQRRQHQQVVDKPYHQDDKDAYDKELVMLYRIESKEQASQHKTETYIYAAYVGYFACMRHAFIRANDQVLGACYLDNQRHTYQTDEE